MHIFTCKDRFEDMMTCIYDAWDWALKNGHENLRLMKEPVTEPTLFDEYVHVDADTEKAEKVVRSIRRSISDDAYICVFYATLSTEADAFESIYQFLRVGFRVGSEVTKMLTIPAVARIMAIRKKIGNEAHYFREFARFTSIDNKVYVCHLEPKNNVVWLVGHHFADRMPSEHWMIIDDTRHIAVVHPANEESYIRYLTNEEFALLAKVEDYEDQFTGMWRDFFTAISIKQRENRACQRNLFPVWMRKHAVEFNSK